MTLKRLRHIIRLPNPLRMVGSAGNALSNRLRRRYQHLDYILFTLPEAMPALPEARGWLRRRVQGDPALSLLDFEQILTRIADDPRPKGIVLTLHDVSMSLADLQTLCGLLHKLRQRGKRIVCYGQMYSLGQYIIASCCDEIIIQPGGELMTVGLREQAVFLKDALDAVGVALDVVAISPYKGAYDQLSRASISPQGREQLEWLLDSRYTMLVDAIATGRGWTREAVQQMIDSSPHLDVDARASGYVDAILNEEGLPDHLGTKHLIPWEKARRRLFSRHKPAAQKHVALLKVSGIMIPGESGGPPGGVPIPLPLVGSERAGDRTVVQQVRQLMGEDNAAAVILFVDSGGGAAIAAEAMTSALEELAKTRPVVVYMNGIAASGGYYIATAGQWIVAQPGTITGSIGVVTAKPITGGLFERLRVHRVEFTRGANATLYSDGIPFTETQRAMVRRSIEHFYTQFIDRVARARKLSPEAVDAISGGRVWTGLQAHAHGLVDELGGLDAALRKARQLANLPDDAPMVIFEGEDKTSLPPQLAKDLDPAAGLRYALDNVRLIFNGTAQAILPVWWETK